MNLESRVAKLEARRSTRRVVWCEPGETVEQADGVIRVRWLDDAEDEPAPVPPPAAPEPVVTPPPVVPEPPRPVVPEPPSRPVHPERPRPTHPTVPTRSPTAAGWT